MRKTRDIRLPRVFGVRPSSSIEEGHVAHGLRLAFGVHHDLMPAAQDDRCVVWVANAALDVNAGIPPHRAPAPALRLRVATQNDLVLSFGDTVGVTRADINRLAAR